VVIILEFFVSIAILLGFLTRPLSLLLCFFMIATALIAHHYWTLSGAAGVQEMAVFFKNLSIAGGLLGLYSTGGGRYSLDAFLSRKLRGAGGREAEPA